MKTKMYLVMCLDGWNNTNLMGMYLNLENATKDIKEEYKDTKGIEELDLKEYASTFGPCFDQEVWDETGDDYLRVFGYILGSEAPDKMIFHLEDLEKETIDK